MIVLQKAEPEKTLQDSHLKPSKTNYLIQKKESITRLLQGGESAGARTRDPNIKSVVLYLLSYGFSKCQHA